MPGWRSVIFVLTLGRFGNITLCRWWYLKRTLCPPDVVFIFVLTMSEKNDTTSADVISFSYVGHYVGPTLWHFFRHKVRKSGKKMTQSMFFSIQKSHMARKITDIVTADIKSVCHDCYISDHNKCDYFYVIQFKMFQKTREKTSLYIYTQWILKLMRQMGR
jgi:hypothetical protein